MVLHTVGRVLLHQSRQYLTDIPTGPSVSSGWFSSWGSLFLSNSRLCQVDSSNCSSHLLQKIVVEAGFMTSCRCWQLAFTVSLLDVLWIPKLACLDRGLCFLSINSADFFFRYTEFWVKYFEWKIMQSKLLFDRETTAFMWLFPIVIVLFTFKLMSFI